jgi:hypothetical protein
MVNTREASPLDGPSADTQTTIEQPALRKNHVPKGVRVVTNVSGIIFA